MNKAFVESPSSIYQPVTKKARVSSASSKIVSVSSSNQFSFTVADLQKCLFNTSTVHPVNTHEVLGKKDGASCFCKYMYFVLKS